MSPSTETDLPIEDRLRAHFADRTAHQPLPGPEADTAVERARSGAAAPPAKGTVIPLVPRRPVLLVAAAAAVVALAVAAGVIATDDDASRVTTGDTPAPTAPPDTDADTGAPSTVPSTTPSSDPSSGTPPPTLADPPPPPAAGDQPAGPIVSVDGILGTWSGSGWVPWEAGATPPTGDEYQIIRLGESIATAVGAAGIDCSPAGQPSIDIGLAYADDPSGPLPIGVTGVVDPRPRPVEVLDPSSAVYQEAAAAVVADLGLAGPAPEVTQVVRGDLDGDGSAEVVVTAQRLTNGPGMFAAPGDYSVVFLRRVVSGEVQASVIASSVAEDAPPDVQVIVEAHRVGAFADLNGDGRMEVVLNASAYEGSSTAVHELRPDGTVPQVLLAGCGA
jgi:hypothetical protein